MNVDATPVPGTPLLGPDPEATANGNFLFDGDASAPDARQIVTQEELMARLTALMRSCEGCENVTVIEVTQIEPPDRRDGCNWSLAIVLDPAGVAPEVYALAYGAVIAAARSSWNLEQPTHGDPEVRGSEPGPDPVWLTP